MNLPNLDHLEISSDAQLWAWLEDNFDKSESKLLVTWKAAHRDKYVSRDAVLDALVAYGWIDGRRWTHDDPRRTIQLVSPRKQSVWAKSYKDRASRLAAQGRMHPKALAAFKAAKREKTWTLSVPIDELEVPADLQSGFNKQAADWFACVAPSYKRNVLRFVAAAKRPATRAKRVALIAEAAARGEKLPNY